MLKTGTSAGGSSRVEIRLVTTVLVAFSWVGFRSAFSSCALRVTKSLWSLTDDSRFAAQIDSEFMCVSRGVI